MKKIQCRMFLMAVAVWMLTVCFPQTAFADDSDIFTIIANKLVTTVQDVRTIVYVIAGFGLVMFAVLAVFNKISFKHLMYICTSLFLLSVMMPFINYFAGSTLTDNTSQQSWGDKLADSFSSAVGNSDADSDSSCGNACPTGTSSDNSEGASGEKISAGGGSGSSGSDSNASAGNGSGSSAANNNASASNGSGSSAANNNASAGTGNNDPTQSLAASDGAGLSSLTGGATLPDTIDNSAAEAAQQQLAAEQAACVAAGNTWNAAKNKCKTSVKNTLNNFAMKTKAGASGALSLMNTKSGIEATGNNISSGSKNIVNAIGNIGTNGNGLTGLIGSIGTAASTITKETGKVASSTTSTGTNGKVTAGYIDQIAGTNFSNSSLVNALGTLSQGANDAANEIGDYTRPVTSTAGYANKGINTLKGK